MLCPEPQPGNSSEAARGAVVRLTLLVSSLSDHGPSLPDAQGLENGCLLYFA